jgi:hypothetical protein
MKPPKKLKRKPSAKIPRGAPNPCTPNSGRRINVETTLMFIKTMSLTERQRFFQQVLNQSLTNGTGFLVIPEKVFDEIGHRIAGEIGERAAQELNQTLDKWKPLIRTLQRQKGTRKSSSENIRRNLEICTRHKNDPKRWSLEKLRREYRFGSIRAVTRILKDKDKWQLLTWANNPAAR